MAVPFYRVDVFVDRPLTGNPLATMPDAEDLTEDKMRAIAREFNGTAAGPLASVLTRDGVIAERTSITIE